MVRPPVRETHSGRGPRSDRRSASEIRGRLGWLRLPSFAGAFPRRRCFVRLVGESCRRIVRAYWLARGRGSFGPWSDPGLAAATRLPLLAGVGRRPSPVARSPGTGSRRAVGLSKVRSTRGKPSSPARLTTARAFAPDRSTGRLSCGSRLASLRRLLAAPCRPGAAGLPDHPASAFRAGHDTQAVSRVALAVFAPRVPCSFTDRSPRAFLVAPAGDAARAGHSCLVFFGQRTFRARARAVLAAWPAALSRHRRRPWGLPTLRSVAPDRG